MSNWTRYWLEQLCKDPTPQLGRADLNINCDYDEYKAFIEKYKKELGL